jgi:hypothetical protein
MCSHAAMHEGKQALTNEENRRIEAGESKLNP